jgi:hypothetical protein
MEKGRNTLADIPSSSGSNPIDPKLPGRHHFYEL